MRLVTTAAALALAVAGAVSSTTSASAAAANVTIDSDSADINVAQDLGTRVEVARDTSEDDTVDFVATRDPATSSGPEGTTDTYVSQTSTVQTPSTDAFPTRSVSALSVSGRLNSAATRTPSSTGGTPVARSTGSFVADFTVNTWTPVQFDGSLRAANNDTNDCTDITVTLVGTGSQNYSFTAGAGSNGTCNGSVPSRSFVVTDALPPDSYELTVHYDGEVTADDPGTFAASGAVDARLQFFKPCTQVGTPGDDTILGTSGDDVLCGRGGDDTISGAGGNDLVLGEAGNDSISGGPGNDVIRADMGRDTVHGGGGADTIFGGSGDDSLFGEDGADIVSGGSGADLVDGGTGPDVMRGDDGRDAVLGRGGADLLVGGPGHDDLEGGTENDTFRARDGAADTVHGGPGAHDVAYVDSRDTVSGVEAVHR